MNRARLLSHAAWLFVAVWSKLTRVRYVNREVTDRLISEGKNFIYAFFHGDLFPLIYAHRDSGVLIPVSESRDGEIMARLLRHYGFEVVRGSSKRKGGKALLALVHGIRRGKILAIAVDGPRGPRHVVKPGTIFLAATSKAPIIPVVASASRFWVLKKSWDKMMFPAPFAECTVMYGDPIYPNDSTVDTIESIQKKLDAELRRLSREVKQNHVNALDRSTV
jgi:lysophospholipid acyltransferase (LPLAT)-like uncharacterized protein